MVFFPGGNPWQISEWRELEVPEAQSSMLIELMGSDSSRYPQLGDLIDPQGKIWVRSGLKGTFSDMFNFPTQNMLSSLNPTVAVLQHHSASLVPNFPFDGVLPKGKWKYRIYSQESDQTSQVQVSVHFHSETSRTYSPKLTFEFYFEQGSAWSESDLEYLFDATRRDFEKVGVYLEKHFTQMIKLGVTDEVTVTPDKVTKLLKTKGHLTKNKDPKVVRVYFLSELQGIGQSVNGFSCLPGMISQSHDCLVTLFRKDLIHPQATLAQMGKVLTHEIGHYLGLLHTEGQKDNVMAQGLLNDRVYFSPSQIRILLKNPLLYRANVE